MLGFKINQNEFPRSSVIQLERFSKLPVANISDVMWRMSASGSYIRPMHNGSKLIGSAFTVKTRPGDNLMVHKALEMAQPGDVLVVDAGGDLTNAIIGEIMVAYAIQKKLAGIIINGAIRDSDEIAKGEFPVYAAGITHRGPYKDGPGEINMALSIDGMIINPGDIIIGDADGCLAIPLNEAELILEKAEKKLLIEEQMMADIANHCLDTSWIDKRLEEQGCQVNNDETVN